MKPFISSTIKRIFGDNNFESEHLVKIRGHMDLIDDLPEAILYNTFSKRVCKGDHTKKILAVNDKLSFVETILVLFEIEDNVSVRRKIHDDFENIDISEQDIQFTKIIAIFLDIRSYNESIDHIKRIESFDYFMFEILEYISLDESDKDVLIYMKSYFKKNFSKDKSIDTQLRRWINAIVQIIEKKINTHEITR